MQYVPDVINAIAISILKMLNKIHFCLIFLVKIVTVKNNEIDNELFGTGIGQEVQPVSLISFRIILPFFVLLILPNLQQIEYSKHLSSSMEDLLKLYHHEQILLNNSSFFTNLTEAKLFLKQTNHR